MGLPVKVPRIKLPGATKFNRGMDSIAKSIEYLFNATGSGPGVSVTLGSSGPVVRVNVPAGVYIGTVTTAVPAGNGLLTYSTAGVVTVLDDTGTALAPGQLTGLPVKNYHEKGFALGATVGVFYASGAWWVFDVGRCTDYA